MAGLTITPNCEYERYAYRWQRIRDIDDGEARLKEVDLSYIDKMTYSVTASGVKRACRYLRPLTPGDTSTYNKDRNAAYIQGARLYNATSRTLNGLMGMLFRVEPTAPELPSQIEYILEDVDGSGQSMDQQCQSVARDVLAIGRDGLLADMPRNDDGREITQADVQNGFRATIQEYKAESIIDWHESIINGMCMLDLLVLMEKDDEFADEYAICRREVIRYKVYRLTDQGVTVQIYKQGEKDLEFDGQIPVLAGNGQPMTRIPFEFVGSMNNKPSIDGLPMEPIANVNIGHYQESANMASSSFNLSAAQPVISDDRYQQAQRDPNKQEQTQDFGEQSCLVLGSGGSFNIVAPPENSLATGLSEKYEAQMVALGAQLITDSSGNETAQAAKIKHASDVSVLDTVANNVSDAYSKMIEYVCELMGVEYDDYRYELNRDFFEGSLTGQDLTALVATWQAGAISKNVLDNNLVKAKIIPQGQDLEEMNEELEAEKMANPQGGVNFDQGGAPSSEQDEVPAEE